MKIRLALLAVALVFSALAAEILLRGYFSISRNYDIEMWKYSHELKQEVDDGRAHVHRPRSSARLMGVELRTNSDGDRGADPDPDARPFVALGDSLTLGWGVSEEETFARRLEPLLGAPVRNRGIGNYNLSQVAASLELRPEKNARAVIYFFYINDAEPTQREYSGRWWNQSVAVAFLRQAWRHLQWGLQDRTAYESHYKSYYQGASWDEFEKNMTRLAKAAASAPFGVVLLPDLRDPRRSPFRDEHRKIADFLSRRSIACLDLLPSFESYDGSELWVAPDDPHPNARAHEIIASLSAPFILGLR